MIGHEKKIVVLGACSSIGQAIARKYASMDVSVLLAGRDLAELEKICSDLKIRYSGEHYFAHFDALDFASHQGFLENCLKSMGRVTHLIICSGFMALQEKCEKDWSLTEKTLLTNYAGAVSIAGTFATYFEEEKEGTIIGISSVAGDRGRQSNFIYGSAKGAFSLYLSGLRNRLFKNNVHVMTVKPGFVDTKMTFGLKGLFLVASPDKVADDIFWASMQKKNEIYTPFFWRYILLIIKLIPEFIFKRMKL
ncbi:SDR family oxidoreductase [Candidatus Riflebacteria bacterium]